MIDSDHAPSNAIDDTAMFERRPPHLLACERLGRSQKSSIARFEYQQCRPPLMALERRRRHSIQYFTHMSMSVLANAVTRGQSQLTASARMLY